MKILEVATSSPPYKGGVSRLVEILSEGLRKRGHFIQILTPQIRFKELSFSGIPFRRYNDYDIIHLHGPTPFLSDLTLLTNSQIPIVYTHHCEPSWISEKISKIYRTLHRFLSNKRAKTIIVHSRDYARLFPRRRAKIIRMPCKFKPPTNIDFSQKSNVFTVLFVGQFRPYKGIDVLLRAAYMLKNINLALVGEGYLKSKILHMIKTLGLKNVKVLGGVNDDELIKLYKSAHVICLPSINTCEAYGLSLIEGALYGCLPLASNLPGVRENISMLKGLLFEPRSHTSLAGKIKVLSEDREMWAALARVSQKAAYNYVTTYTPEYYVREHEEVFKSVLNEC